MPKFTTQDRTTQVFWLKSHPFEDKKKYMRGPYATVVWGFVWDADTSDEVVKPTLTMVSVPKAMRDKGLGYKLVLEVLKEAKCKGIKQLWFENYATGFWEALAKKKGINMVMDGRTSVGYLIV